MNGIAIPLKQTYFPKKLLRQGTQFCKEEVRLYNFIL